MSVEQITKDYVGLKFDRKFTKDSENVYDIPVRSVNVEIKDVEGNKIFDQKNVEIPENWSDQSARIVASKYFKDKIGDENGTREYSVKQLVARVADTIAEQGVKQNLFNDDQSKNFRDELAYMLLNQYAAFNSPVWFNVGLDKKYGFKIDKAKEEKFHYAWDSNLEEFVNNIDIYERPQCSACFISSVKDEMGSILDLSKKEAMLFKWGSGNGTNFKLRGYSEPLSKGGVASGVMYFLVGYDHWAKIIKSGGKTRRAAKMVILDIDHPDIYRFVKWKGNEELKAKALQVFDRYSPENESDWEDEAHFSVSGQNSNNSVRISDKFMIAYQEDGDWDLLFITARDKEDLEEKEISLDNYVDDRYFSDKEYITGLTNKRKITKARTLMDIIAREAKNTGDPGVQFDDIINDWNTCSNSGKINASNPCSEYMFLDDSACNLASINYIKFLKENGTFDVDAFKHACEIMITAQEIIVDYASYPGPDKNTAQNSHDFRPLGLGFGNLGALLMRKGIAYDSDKGRAFASSLASLLTGVSYNHSAKIAEITGPFVKFEENKKSFLNVMHKHKNSTYRINIDNNSDLEMILESAKFEWDKVVKQTSFRNSQVSVIAPTGTIGFMMDLDTFGIEPLIGLRTQKNLSGGGMLKLVNKSVNLGLKELGYDKIQRDKILEYIKNTGNIVGSPEIKEEHYPIFSVSLGKNSISYMGHVKMMAAVQPFISGGISKTVNLPRNATVEDIKNVYTESWKLGLKSISLYVEGSKAVEPLYVSRNVEKEKLNWGERKRLTAERDTFAIKVRVGNTPVHYHFGEDSKTGQPLEFFVSFGGAGSDYSNVYDSLFKSMSRAVQFGETLDKLVEDHNGAIGAINGFTDHPYVKSCTSIEDLWAKLVAGHYLEKIDLWHVKPDPSKLRINVINRRKKFEVVDRLIHPEHYGDKEETVKTKMNGDGEIKSLGRICTSCGNMMINNGAHCFVCPTCFGNTGCS